MKKWRLALWRELADARDKLHREVAQAAGSKRRNERNRRNGQKGVRQQYLEVGDYVLVGWVHQALAAKLQVSWLGPRRIIHAHSDWLFDVEDLRNGAKSQHHISRLKLYPAKDANVSQDLMDHVAYTEGGHIVEELRDVKFDRPRKMWMIQVKWRGLEEIECSWVPVDHLLEDFGCTCESFCCKGALPALLNIQKLADAYSFLSSPTE